MGLPVRDQALHTYGEYLAWTDPQRYELINGIAYAMTPAPTRLHQKILLEIARQIADVIDDSPCEVYVAPFDVHLPRSDEPDENIDTVVQPDLSVIRDPGKLDERGCRGAPDWIIEILSSGTAAHDQTRKREVYERTRVAELWLVHPADRTVTIYHLEGTGYGRPDIFELAGTSRSAVLPMVSIEWKRMV